MCNYDEFRFSDGQILCLADPYYGGEGGFETVIDLLENSLTALAEKCRRNNAS